jgi:polyisoprenoid-binding protein YceI
MTNTSTDLRPSTYLIDTGRSRVEFTATHSFGLKPTTGTMAIRSGTVTVAAEPRRSTVSADLDPATFTTDDPRRDRDVRGKRFLDAAAYPSIAFRSTRVTSDRIIGQLSIRDTTSEAVLAITAIEPTVDGYRFIAETTIDRVAAGVRTGRAIIGRLVTVRLTICVTAG